MSVKWGQECFPKEKIRFRQFHIFRKKHIFKSSITCSEIYCVHHGYFWFLHRGRAVFPLKLASFFATQAHASPMSVSMTRRVHSSCRTIWQLHQTQQQWNALATHGSLLLHCHAKSHKECRTIATAFSSSQRSLSTLHWWGEEGPHTEHWK